MNIHSKLPQDIIGLITPAPVSRRSFFMTASAAAAAGYTLAAGPVRAQAITTDNGPEFAGKALDLWSHDCGITHTFIRPGKPVENAYIESFNGRVRDECLNLHWFHSLDQARLILTAWRHDDNDIRPHTSLGGRTPNEFARLEQAG